MDFKPITQTMNTVSEYEYLHDMFTFMWEYSQITLSFVYQFLIDHSTFTNWIGNILAIYLSYRMIRQFINLINRVFYILVIILCFFIYQRGLHSFLTEDLQHFVDVISLYYKNNESINSLLYRYQYKILKQLRNIDAETLSGYFSNI